MIIYLESHTFSLSLGKLREPLFVKYAPAKYVNTDDHLTNDA